MKQHKVLLIMMTLLLALTLSACGKQDSPAPAENV